MIGGWQVESASVVIEALLLRSLKVLAVLRPPLQFPHLLPLLPRRWRRDGAEERGIGMGAEGMENYG